MTNHVEFPLTQITASKAAEYLNISLGQFNKFLRSHQKCPIPQYNPHQYHWTFLLTELEAFRKVLEDDAEERLDESEALALVEDIKRREALIKA